MTCSILTKEGREQLSDLLYSTLESGTIKSEKDFKLLIQKIYDTYRNDSKNNNEPLNSFNKIFFDELQTQLSMFYDDFDWAYAYTDGELQIQKLEFTFNNALNQNVDDTDEQDDKNETNREININKDASFLYNVYGVNSRARADIERRFSTILGEIIFFDPETDYEINTQQGFNKAVMYKLNQIYLNLLENTKEDLPKGNLFDNINTIVPKLKSIYENRLNSYSKDTINGIFGKDIRKTEEFQNLFLLLNFDDLIKLKYKDVITISTLKTGLNFSLNDNKYKIIFGNEHMMSSWSSDEELSDAVKEASGLIRLLFDSIPFNSAENLGLDKVTTLWTKLREGQYLKGGNDKINKDADYIVNNPRLHNFLTYLYINELTHEEHYESKFNSFKELIRAIPGNPVAIEAIFSILYHNINDTSIYNFDLTYLDKKVLTVMYENIFSPDSKFLRAANKLIPTDVIDFDNHFNNYLAYVELFLSSTVNITMTLLTQEEPNGIYELNTIIARNKKTAALRYRDMLCRNYSAARDLGSKLGLFSQDKPKINDFNLDTSEIKIEDKETKINEKARLKIILDDVIIAVTPELKIEIYNTEEKLIKSQNVISEYPSISAFILKVLHLKYDDFEKTALSLYKSNNIQERDLVRLAGEVLYNYTISSKIINDLTQNVYSEKGKINEAYKYYIDTADKELFTRIKFLKGSNDLLPVFSKANFITLTKVSESNDVLNGINRDTIVKGADGNMVSSKTTTQMIANCIEQIQRCKRNPDSPIKHFLLLDAFVGPEIARDIKGIGFNKKITDLSSAELAEFDFIYDYALEVTKTLNDTDKDVTMRVLPLIISDKLRILKTKFDLNTICPLFNKPYKQLNSKEIREVAKFELGNYYEEMFNNISKDWDTINNIIIQSRKILNDYGIIQNSDLNLLISLYSKNTLEYLFDFNNNFRNLNSIIKELKESINKTYLNDFESFLKFPDSSLKFETEIVFKEYLKEYATDNDLDIQTAKAEIFSNYNLYLNGIIQKELENLNNLLELNPNDEELNNQKIKLEHQLNLVLNLRSKFSEKASERTNDAIQNLIVDATIQVQQNSKESENLIEIIKNSYYIQDKNGLFHINPALLDELYRWGKITKEQLLKQFEWSEEQINSSRGNYNEFFELKDIQYISDLLQDGVQFNLIDKYGNKLNDPKIEKLIESLNQLGEKDKTGNWVTYGNSIILSKIKYQGYDDEGNVVDKYFTIKNLDSLKNNTFLNFAIKYYKENHPEFKYNSIAELVEAQEGFSLQTIANILPEYLKYIDKAILNENENEKQRTKQLELITNKSNEKLKQYEEIKNKAQLDGDEDRVKDYEEYIENIKTRLERSILNINKHYDNLKALGEKVKVNKGKKIKYNSTKVIINPLLQKFNELSYVFGLEFTNAVVGSYINHSGGKNISNIVEYQSKQFQQQVKRNVTLSASKHSFLLNTLEGLSSTVKAALVTNTQDLVSTILGDIAEVFDYDGALFTSGITNYLENKSLKGDSVGVDKKIFIHDFVERLGLGKIIKCAGFSTTNWRIRNSNLWEDLNYKQLTGNESVLQQYLINGGLDITKSFNGAKLKYGKIIYKKKDNQLPLYEYDKTQETVRQSLGQEEYQLKDFFRLNHILEISNIDGFVIKNINGVNTGVVEFTVNDYTTNEVGVKMYAQIKNVHDLWLFLGGAYSMDSVDSKTYNEKSFEQATNAVNYIGKLNEDGTVRQYLKESIIHYMPSVECTKQGASNINDIKLFNKRNNKLALFDLNLYDAGVLLNAEHESDDSILSMMTQVVNALGARGYTADEANEVYEALHGLTKLTLSEYLTYIKDKGSENSKEHLTRFITQVLYKTLKSQSNDVNPDNLADCLILQATVLIEENARKRNDKVNYNDIKEILPIDDPMILNRLMSNISSILVNSCVKMKFPGTMDVLVPSNGFMILYGNKLLGEYEFKNDIYNLKDILLNSTHEIRIGRTYKIITEIGVPYEFLDKDGCIKVETPKEYYSIKKYLQNNSALIYEVPSKGRDLAGYNLIFSDINGNYYNIWDVDAVKNAFVNGNQTKFIQILQDSLNTLNPNNKNSVYISVDGKMVEVNKKSIQIEPYEVIMSLLYQTLFGLRTGDSVSDIENDELFFLKRMLELWHSTPSDDIFDIELKTIDGNHKYLIQDNNIPADFQKSENIQEDEKGLFWYCNYKGEKLFQIKENDSVYTNGKIVLIKTDDVKFYLNSINHIGIKLSTRLINKSNLEIEALINSFKDSNSDLAKLWVERYNEFSESKNDLTIALANVYSPEQRIKDLILKYSEIDQKQIETLNNAIKSKNNDKLYELINNSRFLFALNEKAKEIHTSFIKSLDILAARIPAQCMQSFMAMKIVGFDESGLNSAYVSRWQIYLQGSDFDIDKVSLLGFKFRHGLFVKWSPHMDLSSEQHLRASENLPFPTGESLKIDEKTFKEVDNPNLQTEIENLLNTKDKIDFLLQLSNIIKQVNKLGGIPSTLSNSEKIKIVNIIDAHNLYINLDYVDSKGALINFVSSRMHSISKNACNQEQAQSSVDAANGSAQRIKNMTIDLAYTLRLKNVDLGALSSLYRTKDLTLGGKSNTGIVAASLKVFEAMLLYSYNILNYGTEEQIRNLLINKEICKQKINLLANVYQQVDNPNVPEEFKEFIKNHSEEDFYLMFSGFLSLATDNAKDPTLAKINAESKMIGLYLAGFTLGISIDKLIPVLTSKAAIKIANLMKDDLFNHKEGLFDVTAVINYLLNPNIENTIYINEDVKEQLFNIFTKESGNENKKISDFNPYTYVVNKIKSESKYEFLDKLKEIIDNGSSNNESISKLRRFKEKVQNFINLRDSIMYEMVELGKDKDGNPITVNVFSEIRKLERMHQEMLDVSRITKLNQGLPNKIDELINWKRSFEKIISKKKISGEDGSEVNDRLKELNSRTFPKYNESMVRYKDLLHSVNFNEFIENPEYRAEIINIYEKAKFAINIFDMFNNLEHYKGYSETLASLFTIAENISPTWHLVDHISASINPDLDDLKITMDWVNSCTINLFLSEYNLIFNIKNYPYFTQSNITLSLVTDNEDGVTIKLGTPSGNATFKYLVEKYVLELLKSTIVNNKLLNDLSFIKTDKTFDKGITEKLATDVKLIPSNDYERRMLDIYKESIELLSGVRIPMFNNISALDMLFLYNLIVNDNKSGENNLTPLFLNYIFNNRSKLINDYFTFRKILESYLSKYVDALSGKDLIEYKQSIAKITPFPLPSGKNAPDYIIVKTSNGIPYLCVKVKPQHSNTDYDEYSSGYEDVYEDSYDNYLIEDDVIEDNNSPIKKKPFSEKVLDQGYRIIGKVTTINYSKYPNTVQIRKLISDISNTCGVSEDVLNEMIQSNKLDLNALKEALDNNCKQG